MMQLSELMDAAERIGQDFCKDGELDYPILVMRTMDREGLTVAPLVIDGPGAIQALAVHFVIDKYKASMAVLVCEAWMAKVSPETVPDKATRQRLAEGKMGVRDLPPEARMDSLILTGETNEGECLDRWFIIHPGEPRTFEPHGPNYAEGEKSTNRFRPLFRSNDDRLGEQRIPWEHRRSAMPPLEDV